MTIHAKCVDCGKRLDFRAGVAMRGPLDARTVCLPCSALLAVPQVEMFKAGQPNGKEQEK